MNVMSYVDLDEPTRKRMVEILIRCTNRGVLKWEPDSSDRHTCDFNGYHIVAMKETDAQGAEAYALTVKTKDEPYKKYYAPELGTLFTEIEKQEPDVLKELLAALEKRI